MAWIARFYWEIEQNRAETGALKMGSRNREERKDRKRVCGTFGRIFSANPTFADLSWEDCFP